MRWIAIAALALGLAACNNDSTSPSGSVSGSYTLRTVNGSSLPYTYSDGFTVTSGNVTLSNDGNYSLAFQFNDGSVLAEQGFWSNINGSITFDDRTHGGQYQGSLSGDVLTEILDNETDVFQRQ
jgi:hypothetical protein